MLGDIITSRGLPLFPRLTWTRWPSMSPHVSRAASQKRRPVEYGGRRNAGVISSGSYAPSPSDIPAPAAARMRDASSSVWTYGVRPVS